MQWRVPWGEHHPMTRNPGPKTRLRASPGRGILLQAAPLCGLLLWLFAVRAEAVAEFSSHEATEDITDRAPALQEPDRETSSTRRGERATDPAPGITSEDQASHLDEVSRSRSSSSEAAHIDTPRVGETAHWDDAEVKARDTAQAAVRVCEAIAFPLTLVPGVGSVAASLVDWGCLVPAALAVDYVGVHHGDRGGSVWPPLMGLIAAKLVRTGVMYVSIAGALIVGGLYATVVTAALISANAAYYIPVGVTGLLAIGGASGLLIHRVSKAADRAAFSSVYESWAPRWPDDSTRRRIQGEAWLKPKLDGTARGYALMTAAGMVEVEGDFTHGLPVVGPVYKAEDRITFLKAQMRRVGADLFGELPKDPAGMDAQIELWLRTEGYLEAGAHACLLAGAAIFAAGSISSAVAYQQTGDEKQYAELALGLGTTGIVVAGTGVGLLLARDVPRIARTWFVPMAFGFDPPESLDVE